MERGEVSMSFKGYVQVYTGNGKGKTTAAIGLAIRALGAGKKVLFLQFMKSPTYSEHKILPEISSNLTMKTLASKNGVISLPFMSFASASFTASSIIWVI